jgi:four helix bundle protein
MDRPPHSRPYEDLHVWQKAMDFADEVYDASEDWPPHELYGLRGQVRRAVVSVPANVAEGYGRLSDKEFLHHLSIAHASLMEAETHLQFGLR